MNTSGDSDRFQTGAETYAAYLDTPEGRLRSDLAFANLLEWLPAPAESLRALDIGSGTGTLAIRLARLGIHVTLLDSSAAMLEFACKAAQEAGVASKIALEHGGAHQVANLFRTGSFDVVLCHNTLEFVDDPGAVLLGASRVMTGSSAILSVLVRARAGEVLKAAIQAGDLAAAENNLAAEWGQESLFGGPLRLFIPERVQLMLTQASLVAAAVRGVRVVSDYLPANVSRTADYARIFELERKLGSQPEFAAVARYTQYLARIADPAVKDLP